MPISCHFRDCKALLVTSLTHVSGAIARVQTFYLKLPLPLIKPRHFLSDKTGPHEDRKQDSLVWFVNQR